MNVWKERCRKELAEGRFWSIRDSFASDITGCVNMEQLIGMASEWLCDLEDMMEEMNGRNDG